MGEDTDWVEGRAPAPAYLQEALVYPEFRVYVIGAQLYVFETFSDQLDFRTDRNARTRYVPQSEFDAELGAKLIRMAHGIGLDFCAFDLKTRAQDGALCFLEVNSSPMFTAFDALAEGALSQAILFTLAGR